MPYNVEPLNREVSSEALTATGFAKQCEHGHWIHTPNNSPLPAHTADYHDPNRNGIGGHYPDPNGSQGQGDLRFDQFHENDLTGRGYDKHEIMSHLLSTNGDVSMCPHGGVVNNSTGSCHTGAHTPPFMRGVERNMPYGAQEDALTDPDSEWRVHHTWNSMNSFHHDQEDDASGYMGPQYPRNEQQLVDQEPERVEEIRQRIAKVVSLAESPRSKNSDYTTRLFPSGALYDSHDLDDKSPERAEREGRNWGRHSVVSYHKGTAIGRLDYDSSGHVHGWYIDHRHQNGLANVQMLADAHKHLLSLGNPIGLLHSDTTTSNSAAVIRKIDPESTWLRQPDADSGWNSRQEWNPGSHDDRVTPLLPEHTERRTRREWADLSDATGLNIHDLHAISPDFQNRNKADLSQVSDPEAKAIHLAYRQDIERKEASQKLDYRMRQRDSIPGRVAAFSIPAGFMGDTANLETQMPEETNAAIGDRNPHLYSNRIKTGMEAMQDLLPTNIENFTSTTGRRIIDERFSSSDNALTKQGHRDASWGKNLSEELARRISDDATGVWTGEESPVTKSPEERAKALMAVPRHKRPF